MAESCLAGARPPVARLDTLHSYDTIICLPIVKGSCYESNESWGPIDRPRCDPWRHGFFIVYLSVRRMPDADSRKDLPALMAKKTAPTPQEITESNLRLVTGPDDKDKALKWFARGRELGDKRQFEMAIEYYVNGLEFWPEAVEEALKPFHGCAVARKQTGGKKPGLTDSLKRSVNDKDPKQAYLNSLWLFGREPDNAAYAEAILKNAARLRAEDAAKWAAGVLHKALEANPKTTTKQFQGLVQSLEEMADRAASRNEHAFGVAALQLGVDVVTLWRRRIQKDNAADAALKSVSTKLTILKGKYQDEGSYRDSIVDASGQADLHDQQRTVTSEERLDELIAKVEAEYESDPNPATLKNFVDMLCRRERDDEERKAIGLLVNEFKQSGEYRWKLMADDIRMKQLGRALRERQKEGDADAIKQARIEQIRFELSVYKDRVERYPTDNRAKFELGVRRFHAGQFDEAIPLFQVARNDPKNRAASEMYLGRCFFRKGYHSQAVSALQEAIKGHEFPDDELAKTMNYWLGRAQEAGGEKEAARATYGNILRLDYNYSDVRARLDALSK